MLEISSIVRTSVIGSVSAPPEAPRNAEPEDARLGHILGELGGEAPLAIHLVKAVEDAPRKLLGDGGWRGCGAVPI